MRFPVAMMLVTAVAALAACASSPPTPGKIDVRTTSRSLPLAGADCTVETGAGRWTVVTPGSVVVGQPAGELRVVCNKAGYRSSEVIDRSGFAHGGGSSTRLGVGVGGGLGRSSGVGVSLGMGFPFGSVQRGYPAEVVVDMNLQQDGTE